MNIFDTDEKRQAAINNFKSLLDHPGWKLIVQVLQSSIERLEADLENGTEAETIHTVNRIRDQLRLDKRFRDMPNNLIDKLSDKDTEEIRFDPYDKVSDLDKEETKP